MSSPSSSSSSTSCRWVAVTTSTQAAWARGRSKILSAPARRPGGRPARVGASPRCASGRRSAITCSTSTLAYSCSTAISHLLADRVVLDEVRRNPLDAALVEDGAFDGEGEHPDEGHEHREDGEDASSDQARATSLDDPASVFT